MVKRHNVDIDMHEAFGTPTNLINTRKRVVYQLRRTTPRSLRMDKDFKNIMDGDWICTDDTIEPRAEDAFITGLQDYVFNKLDGVKFNHLIYEHCDYKVPTNPCKLKLKIRSQIQHNAVNFLKSLEKRNLNPPQLADPIYLCDVPRMVDRFTDLLKPGWQDALGDARDIFELRVHKWGTKKF